MAYGCRCRQTSDDNDIDSRTAIVLTGRNISSNVVHHHWHIDKSALDVDVYTASMIASTPAVFSKC